MALRALPLVVQSLNIGTIGHNSIGFGRHIEYVFEEGGILDSRHTWFELDLLNQI